MNEKEYLTKGKTLESMSAHFHQHFKLVVANTPKLREEVYKIRYKVYCQELGYEREDDCKNGMEHDIYDQRSIHCLLMHLPSRLYAGCVRLVLPDPHTANLPFERVLGYSWQSNRIEQKNSLCHSFAEVSRLAVTTDFRKRQEVSQSELSQEERSCFPLIPLGLYLAATSIVVELGLDGAFALMEPRLARHLGRFGIRFHQIGELVEFHGQRGLFQILREAVLNGMNADTYKLFQMLCFDVRRSLVHSALSLHRRAA